MKKIIISFVIFSSVFLNMVYAEDVEIKNVYTYPTYVQGCKGGSIVFDVVVAAGVIVDYVQVVDGSGNEKYISGPLPFYLFESKSYHFAQQALFDLYAGGYTIVVKEAVIGDKKYYYNYPHVDDGPAFNFTLTGTSPTSALCSNGNIRISPNTFNLETIDYEIYRNGSYYTSFENNGRPDVAVPSGHYSVTSTYHGYDNSCSGTVTHEIDLTAPGLPVLPDVTGECSATASAATITDNCAGAVTGTTSDPLTYTTQGTHVIHWNFDAGNGIVATTTQNVIIDDITAPDVPVLPDVTGECSATASIATTTDNCVGTVTGTTSDALTYTTQGTYVIHWSFNDGNGNASTQNQTVTLKDVTEPSIICPANIILSACESTATWLTPIANDNCSGVTVIQTGGPVSGSTFTNGSTTIVTYTATDVAGNQKSCSFTVTRASVLTATCSNTNPQLYFGYAGDQTSTIKGIPNGGVGPYTVSITMNRALICNFINDAGDEIWTGSAGGTTSGNGCPVFPNTSGSIPVSTKTGIASGSSYSVNVSLLTDAVFTITVIDANGCSATCITTVSAEDVRCFAGKSNVSKVTLCHRTGSAKNPCVTICVDEDAVAEHIAHGDFLGKCTPDCISPLASSNSFSSSLAAPKLTDNLSAETLNVEIFPNPCTQGTEFTLVYKGNSKESIQIRVLNMYGKEVYQTQGAANQTYKFGGQFMPGIYIVKVLHGKEVDAYKVIKVK